MSYFSRMTSRIPSGEDAMTVVIVEDNERVADLYIDVLEGLGHAARPFRDGESFLETLPALEADLLILDRGLPGCDGLEVAHRVRAAGAGLPILMISGNPPAPGASKAIDRVLAKPCTLAQFTDAVTSLLGRGRRPGSPRS
jgi:two-component system OmpR family response regulator